MKTLDIQGRSGPSAIHVGEGLDNLPAYLPRGRSVIITDTNVNQLYGNRFPDAAVIEIGSGEGIKTLETMQEIFDRLIACEADRSTFIVGIGGGIVCDMTGFVGSTYLRGVRFGFVASTLLAQVDASVGGKNGVNFRGYKNMVGVFNQPEFVLCDLDLLSTLPEREIHCGFAEIVKHAAIADAALFAFIEENAGAARNLDRAVLERLVYDSVVIKAGIVNRDEREAGERRNLNFGHTFGHAVEKIAQVPHGEAVSIGMAVAASLSAKRGLLDPGDAARLVRLLNRLHLPTRLSIDPAKAIDALRHDKKREGDAIHFVLLRSIGESVIEAISITELEAVVHELYQC